MSDPTPEQEVAIDLFRAELPLVVQAGAGTGKTTTLRSMAATEPTWRGQYIAFNRAIVEEAKAKMPRWVAASTAHGLAFKAVGARYAHRLQSHRMRSMEIARMLKIDPIYISYGAQTKVLQPSTLAGYVMKAVGQFCQTADPHPTGRHVPYIDGIDLPTQDGRRTYGNNDVVRATLEPKIAHAWADLQSTTGQLPYKHDHYLKLWQLNSPRIAADYVLFDEGQDANPVMLDIVLQQAEHGVQLVWVGDSQQAIYGFTGAVDALDRAAAAGSMTSFLTQSFRFGPAIADLANVVLDDLDAELRLTGLSSIPSQVCRLDQSDVVLCRTNAEAVTTVLNTQKDGRTAALVGGAREVITFAEAATELKDTGRTWHPDLICFESWLEVQEYVEHDAQGGELKALVGLVDDFGADVIKQALSNNPNEDAADVVVSTAHKAKGREWDTVRLAGDFPDLDERDGDTDEEKRLLYVGVTRARLKVDVSSVPFFQTPT